METTYPVVIGPWNDRTNREMIEYIARPAFSILLGLRGIAVNVVGLRPG